MTKKLKKSLATLLAMSMILSMASVSAFAANEGDELENNEPVIEDVVTEGENNENTPGICETCGKETCVCGEEPESIPMTPLTPAEPAEEEPVEETPAAEPAPEKMTQVAEPAVQAEAAGEMTGEAFVATAVEGKITLTGDVYLTTTAEITEDMTVTLDLNGYTITVPQTNGRSLYAIDNRGILTITDTSVNGEGKITARGVQNFGTMYMEGGIIESCDSNGGGAAVWNEGTFEMTGGTLAFTGIKSGNNAGVPFNSGANTATAHITGGELVSDYSVMFVSSGEVTVEDISVKNSTSYWMAFKVFSGAELTLKNVTVNSKDGGCVEAAGGTVTLENCTFIQGPTTANPGEQHTSSAVAVSNNGIVNVKGGNYTSAGYGAYVFNSGGTINIEGTDTVIKGENAAIKADTSDGKAPANVNIKEATIEGEFQASPNGGVPVNISIESGTIKTNNSDIGKYIAPTAAYDPETGVVTPYTAETGVAQVGEKFYGSLQDAIDAATEGQTVTLLADVEVETAIDATKSITIDGGENKHSVTAVGALNGDSGRVFNINESDGLKVTFQNMKIVGPTTGIYTRGISAYQAKNLELTLNNVELSANYYALNIASLCDNAKVDITDSTLTGWCAFQTHSPKSVITAKNSTLIGINDKGYNADGWNDFQVVVVNELAEESEVLIENCRIEARATTGNQQDIVSVRSTFNEDGTVSEANSTLELKDCEFISTGVDGVQVEPTFSLEKGNTLVLNGKAIVSGHPAIQFSQSAVEEISVAADEEGKVYTTLQAAIDAARTTAATVELLKSTTESVVIAAGQDITLNIPEGVTLSNTLYANQGDCSTIVNNGTLTVTGEGTVLSQCAYRSGVALRNNQGATATLRGCTFVNNNQSSETSKRTFYVIQNFGTMDIYAPTVARIDANEPAVVTNGWEDGRQNTVQREAVMRIHGGTFTGGWLTVKNDDWGNMVIDGGTFDPNNSEPTTSSNLRAVLNAHKLVINGGTFINNDNDQTIATIVGGYDYNIGELKINGGSFTNRYTGEGALGIIGRGTGATVAITDGVFSEAVKLAHCAEGYLPIANGDGTYGVTNETLTITPNRTNQTGAGAVTLTVAPANLSAEVAVTCDVDGITLTDNRDGTWTTSRLPNRTVTYTFTVTVGTKTATCTVSVSYDAPYVPPVTEPDEDLGDEDTPLSERPWLFVDVKEGDYFYDAVKRLFDKGIVGGTTETTYEPYADATRGMVAQILYGMAGSPDVTGLEMPFSDVKESDFYYNAVLWAYANKVIGGYPEDNTFRGENTITREELAAVLHQYGVEKLGLADTKGGLDGFIDADKISGWAVGHMEWAVGMEIMHGDTAKKLMPQELTIRADMTIMLNNLDLLVSDEK